MRRGRGLVLLLLPCGLVAQTPPEQPVPYSHKKHLALGLKCQMCHPNPEPGDRMTLPVAATCMSCHASVAVDRPSIRTLAGFAAAKQPIPWKRIDAVNAGVYWSHRTHTAAAIGCEDCHGKVAEREVMAHEKDITSMNACVTCHRRHNAPLGCEVCHEGK